jgi:hypothetical protein
LAAGPLFQPLVDLQELHGTEVAILRHVPLIRYCVGDRPITEILLSREGGLRPVGDAVRAVEQIGEELLP